MGVVLTPIVHKESVGLERLRNRLAVDGHGELYQFLALIRLASSLTRDLTRIAWIPACRWCRTGLA